MRFTYDDEADALYIRLREGERVVRSVVVDGDRVVDLGTEGRPVGIEILGASGQVALKDLVDQFDLGEYLPHFRELESLSFRPVALA